MITGRDSLADLEKRRLQLEQNVAKLRKSLRHWQQWEVEYEGMKEELLSLRSDHTQEDIKRYANGNTGSPLGLEDDLLDTKEKRLLIYDNQNNLRSPKTIVNLLSRRIDYVQDNIKTSNSLLRTAEDKLAATSILIHPEAQNEERLPLKDIREELDDEDNVIASSILQPNDNSSEVIKALQKATEEPVSHADLTNTLQDTNSHNDAPTVNFADSPQPPNASTSSAPQTSPMTGRDHEKSASDLSESSSEGKRQTPWKLKKRVSFAEDSKPESDPSEHPKYLPRSEKERLLRDFCTQVRPELESRWGKKRSSSGSVSANGAFGNDLSAVLNYALTDAGVVEPILKYHQNRQARRLLKAFDLNLWEAARVISIMINIDNYDLESKQIMDMISTLNGTGEANKPHNHESTDLTSTRQHESGIAGISKASNDPEYDNASNNDDPNPGVGKSTPSFKLSNEWNENTNQDSPQGPHQSLHSHDMNQAASDGPDRNVKLTQDKEASTETPIPQNNTVEKKEASCFPLASSSQIATNGETLEEASLRRQMLEYNMNEVGAVVAELEFENDDDLSDGAPADEESYVNFDDSDEDEEDGYGRTTSRVLTEDYLAEMQALEKKLNARVIMNAGPEPRVLSSENREILKASTNNTNGVQGAAPKAKNNVRKGVRFAESLDIQEAPPEPEGKASKPSQRGPNPSDKPVVERKALPKVDSANRTPDKKLSRFKAARASQQSQSIAYAQETGNSPISSSSPPLKPPPISSSKVIERPYDPNPKPAVPDDLDPILLNQQVSDQYHRLRNRIIENEGGFLKPDERTEVSIDEDEGVGRKMSRFRATRLGRQ